MSAPAVDRLTADHKAQQDAIVARVRQRVHGLFPRLDMEALDKTFPYWAAGVAHEIKIHRNASANVAARYMAAIKKATGLSDPPVIKLADPVPVDKINAALFVTGVLAVKHAMTDGKSIEAAAASALDTSTGVAERMSNDGAWVTIAESSIKDPQWKGFVREAGGSACAFCSSLEGEITSSDDWQSHSNCQCSCTPLQ